MRQQGYKFSPLKTVSRRVSSELWTACDWAAAAAKVDRSTFVRDTLADATKNVTPPVSPEFLGISGSQAQRETWEKAAAHLQVPIDEFASQAMDYAAKRLLRPKPTADGVQKQS